MIKEYEVNGVVYRDELPDVVVSKSAEIESLKARLAESDFMVIKDWEAEKLGLPLPYLPEEIHAIKQPLRDRINQLEQEINNG